MQIEILSETLDFPNKRDIVPEIIQVIENKLRLAGVYYSHFSMDGVEYYDDLDSFLLENIAGTGKIKIISRTLKELADEVLLSASDYLNRAVPVVTELARNFYREPGAGDWRQLGELAEGVNWLLDSFSIIDRETALKPHTWGYPHWDEYLRCMLSLKEIMEHLEQAMESRDMVLIGDLLNYEIAGIFQQMKELLDDMLPWEV